MQKPKIFIFLLLLFIAPITFAQKGQVFPNIAGETLKGSSLSIPNQTKGKKTLIGVAFSKKSDELLKAWYAPIYKRFIDPPQVAFIPQDEYDINMYFLAMMKGIYKVADGKIMKEMREGLDTRYHDKTIVYQGKIKDYKKELDLGRKDLPYFFVLDENGKIVYHTEGAYNSRKMNEIVAAMDSF